MHEHLIPDVSLGTHFFNDLVESNMLYMALYPKKEITILNKELLNGNGSKLLELLPDHEKLKDVVKIIESTDFKKINIYADPIKQVGILYISR